jgi:hypothetical protein
MDHPPSACNFAFCAWAFKIGDPMKVVLAGFPRVGKTTVFQSLTGLADSTAARGAAARGIIRVPDARVDALSKIYRPRKTTNATVVFVDVQPPEVGSLDKAAVLSAPLGAELKDADAVAAVVRGFPDPYSGAAAEPEREFARFDEELVFTDLAVLDKRAGLNLAADDVFVNVAGGVRIDEPGADLAVALAIASAARGIPVREGVAAFGEIGLTGRRALWSERTRGLQ